MLKKTLFFLFLIFFVSIAHASLLDGLVSYYKLDDANTGAYAVIDSNTIGANLTGVLIDINQTGKIGNAYDFTPSLTSNIQSSDGGQNIRWQYMKKIDSNFTFTTWIKTTFDTNSQGLFTKGLTTFFDIFLTEDKNIQVSYSDGALNKIWQTTNLANVFDNNWHFVVITKQESIVTIKIDDINMDFVFTTTGNPTMGTDAGPIIGSIYGTANHLNGLMDEVGFWDRALTNSEQTLLWNFGAGVSYPFTDINTSTLITGNSVAWTNTSQTITLTCSAGLNAVCVDTNYRLDSGAWIKYVLPFTISTDGNHLIEYFSDDNTGYTEATKTAYAAVDVTAPSTALSIADTNTQIGKRITLTCADSLSGCKMISYKIDGGDWNFFTGSTLVRDDNILGYHTIYYYSTDNADNNETQKTYTYAVQDLVAPTLDYNIIRTYGFSSDTNVAYTLKCTDNSLATLTYDVNLNDTNNIYHSTQPNATTITSWAILPFRTTTTFTFSCIDPAGNTTTVDANTIYTTLFRLINEDLGNQLSQADINTFWVARAYSIDGNYKYDFNSNYTTQINFISTSQPVIFEFQYPDVLGTKITRYIDFSLIPDQNIGVCVPYPYQSFYQQLFTSNQARQVILYNGVARCYSLIGTLSYNYDTGYAQSLYSINKPYYLYYFNSGVKTLLTLVDGSRANSYNLDTIILSRQTYSLNITLDGLSFTPLTTNGNYNATKTIRIYYFNVDNDNTETKFDIYNDINSSTSTLVWSYTENSTPNDVLMDFNWGAIPTLTIDSNMHVVVTKTKTDGTTETFTQYFDLWGYLIPTPGNPTVTMQDKFHIFAAIASLLIFFFGITIIAASRVFGFLGIIMCIISIIICAFATQIWYIVLLEASYFVILVWIVIMGKQDPRGLV